MKIGRNDSCPCGSGKKYKKCCLAFDETQRTKFSSPSDAEEREDNENAPDALEMETASEKFADDPEWDDSEADTDTEAGGEPEDSTYFREYPRVDESLPKLSTDEQSVVDQWWNEVTPYLENRNADEMLRRVEQFLETRPGLFPHLYLHEEFLFELGAELGQRKQWAVYARLLERVRSEQAQTYSFSFGYFDHALISEQIVEGRIAEISSNLSFFKQYPDGHPDQCHALTNLLAWRGLDAPLFELAEAVAVPMLTSRHVINGGFAMNWLFIREMIPFLEARDDSPSAARSVMERLGALSKRLDFELTPNLAAIERELKMAAAPPVPIKLNRKPSRVRDSLSDMEWNFSGYVRAHQGGGWVQARFTAEQFNRYVEWHGNEGKDPFQFSPLDVEHCFVQLSRDMNWFDGVRLLSSFQMLAWLGDYLCAAGGISEDKRLQVRDLAQNLFENARKSVDSTDPAYRLCGTFEQLAPERQSD